MGEMAETKETIFVMEIVFLMLGMVFFNNFLLSWLGHVRKRFPNATQFFPDAIITTSIGIVYGVILYFFEFDSVLFVVKNGYIELLIVILLPPILFEGYSFHQLPFHIPEFKFELCSIQFRS